MTGNTEILTLADAVCSGTATAAQVERLNFMLATDAEAAMLYATYLRMHGQLVWRYRDEIAATTADAPQADAESQPQDYGFLGNIVHNAAGYLWESHTFSYIMTGFIMLVCIGLGVTWNMSDYPIPPQAAFSIQEPSRIYVGEITGIANGQWPADAPRSFHHDRVFIGQRITLNAGMLEITYDTGAKVILQAPVLFEIDSTNSGFVLRGKLTGKITSELARGFTIRTPTATMVDLGTEFGVDVDSTGRTASHVFRGEVKLTTFSSGNEPGREVTLRANEACRVEKQADDAGMFAVVRRDAAQPTHFVQSDDFAKQAQQSYAAAFRGWLAYRDAIRRDPSLLAFYDFQQVAGWANALPNVAASGNRAADGAIQGAVWCEGRMPGKQALQFTRPNDCVRINLPQKTNDLTLAAWLYTEPLLDERSGLLMSEHWRSPGQVRWQQSSNNGTCVEIGGADGEKAFHSVPAAGPNSLQGSRNRFSRWTHLAVVYRQATGRVMFYRDGRLEETYREPRTIGENMAVCIGSATIGFPARPQDDSPESPRNFRGRIDELAVFGRELTSDEILQMYRTGSQSETQGAGWQWGR
jgi:hypothetical protein